MSTTIEQRVVEMRFDNKHFEKNVGQTMTTLEKLKAKLNLSGASKSLQNLNKASNKVNMNNLTNSVENVGRRFSAMEVIGVTALANITNSAVNAGKRIAKALTIDPVMTGFKEYETQINAVQTILSNTQKEGTTIEIVNAALDELNEYADQTIYNFTEMTRNIGTFTAAGVKLDTSVKAIKGISNLAAVSGSTSQQASTAMYQLSQALSSGTVKLMDWNSVVNAGMGGQVFQDALKETARVHGIAIDKMIKQEGSFRDTLSLGWLSSDILTETLEKFTYSAEEGTEEWNNYITALKQKGYTEAQAIEILKLGNNATDAATKVKTFTQLWDVLKESVQSGWAQTWRIIVGDFEEAKALFSPLADFLVGKNGIITRLSNARNKLLEGALSFNPFASLLEKLEKSSVGKVIKKVDGITRSLEEYQKVVRNVWRGKYNNRGDNPDRFDLLRKEGWNPSVVQTLVNLGSEYKLTVKDIAKAEKERGVATEETAKAIQNLSDEQLRNAGLTEDEIEMYRELEKQSKKTGKSIEEIVASMSEKDGRTLLIESFKNVGSSIAKILTAIGEAWHDAFGLEPIQLYNFIAGLNEFTSYLKMSDKTAENLTRTLKGIFAIIDLITMVIGGGFKIAYTILKTVLKMFNLDILQFTAIIGDAIASFRDWVEAHNPLVLIIQKTIPLIIKMGKAIGNLAKKLWELPTVQKYVEKTTNWFKKLGDIKLTNIVSGLKSLGKAIKKVLSNINDHFGGVPGDILAGLVNGLKNGASKVFNTIANIAKKLVETFQKILDINSPSKVFFAIGGFIIAGLIGGLLSGKTKIGEALSSVASGMTEFFGKIDWGKIFTAGLSVGLLTLSAKLISGFYNISKMFGGLGNMFSSVGDLIGDSTKNINKILKNTAKVVKSFSKVLNAIAFKKSTEGIMNLGKTLLILVGAIAILTFLDTAKMWEGVKVIGILAGIIAGLAIVVGLLSKASMSINKNGVQISGLQSMLAGIGIALLMLAIVVKLMGGLEPDAYKRGATALLQMSILLTAMVGILTLIAGLTLTDGAAKNIHKIGKMATKLSFALLILVGVVKLASGLSDDQLIQAGKFIAGFAGLMVALGIAAAVGGEDFKKLGGTVLKLSIALLLIIGVIKLLYKLDADMLTHAAKFAAAFVGFVLLLSLGAAAGGKHLNDLGNMVLKISAALLLLVGVVKLASMLTDNELTQAAKFAAGFAVFVLALALIGRIGGDSISKMGTTILSIAGAVAILAGIVILLGSINRDCLDQGLFAVGVISAIVAVLLGISAIGKNTKNTLIGIAIAIGALALSIGILSFIKPEKLIAPTIALGVLLGLLAVVMAQSKKLTKSTKNLAIMAGIILGLGVVLLLLSKSPWENTISSAAAMSALLVVLIGAFTYISKMKTNFKQVWTTVKGLLALCLPMVALAGMLLLMKNVKNAISSAVGLSLLLGSLTGVLTYLNNLKSNLANVLLSAVGLLALCVPLLGLVGILHLMKNVKNAISSATALSMLLITMTGVLTVLSLIGPIASASYPAMGALAVLIVGLGAIMAAIGALMEYCPELENFLNKGMVVLEKIGYALGSFFGNIVGGFLGGITSGLPDIGRDLTDFMEEAEGFIEGASKIKPDTAKGIKALAEAVLLLTASDILRSLNIFGDNDFGEFGEEIAEFGEHLKDFEDSVEGVDAKKVKTAAEAARELIKIADAVPNSGGLVGWVTGENDLGDFGDEVSEFGEELMEFNKTIASLDKDDIDNIKLSAQAAQELIKIADAVPNSGGLVSWITGDNDLSDFGDEIEDFGDELAKYAENIEGIEPEHVKKSAIAASALIDMVNKVPSDGSLMTKVTGQNDLGEFAANLITFGTNLKSYGENVKGIDSDAIHGSIAAAQGLVDLANALPASDGWLQGVIGGKDLGDFAADLVPFAEALIGYGEVIAYVDIAAINKSNEAVTVLADVAEALNSSDNSFEGNSGFESFVETLIPFGRNLKIYGWVVDGINVESISTSAGAVQGLVDVANALPGEGGIFGMFRGKKDLESFSAQMIPFGENLKSYGEAVVGTKNGAIIASLDAAKSLIEIYNLLPEKEGMFDGLFGGKNFNFAKRLTSVAEGMKDYGEEAADINYQAISDSKVAFNSINDILSIVGSMDQESINTLEQLVTILNGLDFNKTTSKLNTSFNNFTNLGSSVIGSLLTGLKNKKSEIETTCNEVLNQISTIASNHEGSFIEAGATLISKLASGISDGIATIRAEMLTCMGRTLAVAEDYDGKFKTAGENAAIGFANGITFKTFIVEAAAKAMAEKALTAAEKRLDENSPSKEFYKIGDFAGIGFVNALLDSGEASYKAGHNMADLASKGLSKAISRITNVINSDMDTQPTIRPVLDLSDVESGAGYLNTMFNDGPSIGVTSNLRAISSSMATRQNGINGDVVSAIDDLRRDLGNIGGTTNNYNVNGVSYADTDNDINNAVKTLVRAAVVERRI